MRIDDARAAEAVVEIARAHAHEGRMPALPLGQHARRPEYGDVFFPELLEYLDAPKAAFSIATLALSFASTQQLDPAMLLPHADRLLEMLRSRREWLGPRQQIDGIGWMWESAYHQQRRWKAGVLLDLLGHVPTPEVEIELRRCIGGVHRPAAADGDSAGLVAARCGRRTGASRGNRRQRRMPQVALRRAAPARTRHLYPDEFRGQAALAESDLVNWLTYPTELGRPPDEIELVQAIPFHTESDVGWADYFLFRFRTHTPHWSARDGWIAGISGPLFRHRATYHSGAGGHIQRIYPLGSQIDRGARRGRARIDQDLAQASRFRRRDLIP